jgi:starch synthase
MIHYAKYIYYENPKDWEKMVIRAMEKDFSWKSSAKEYEELYRSL